MEGAQDGSWIHLTVVGEGFEQVYLSLKKTDYMVELQQSVNSHAIDGKISFPIDSLNLVNGKYQMTLVGTSATGKALKWDLGTISAWFKEGSQSTTNNHIPSKFNTKPEIEASFPAPDFQGRLWLSVSVVATVFAAFLYYVHAQLTLVTPLAKLNVSGSLLIVSLMGLMALLIAFWIGYVNLLQTMWILAFSAPVSLIFMYRGLQATKIKI